MRVLKHVKEGRRRCCPSVAAYRIDAVFLHGSNRAADVVGSVGWLPITRWQFCKVGGQGKPR